MKNKLLVFAGVPKAGSSWFHSALSSHASVSCARGKDTYFYDRYFGRGYPWYCTHFDLNRPWLADISHDYVFNPESLSRIAAAPFEEVKLLIVLRDPLRRYLSALKYQAAMRNEDLILNDATIERYWKFVEQSQYSSFLPLIEQNFGFSQYRVVIFERFFADPENEYSQFLDWMGLEYLPGSVQLSPVRASRVPAHPRAVALGRAIHSRAREAGLGRFSGVLKNWSALDRRLFAEGQAMNDPDVPQEIRRLFDIEVEQTSSLLNVDLRTWWSPPLDG